jgi:hypothetical protein
MDKILVNIFSLGLKPLWEKNNSYYKIVKEFREKLPRHQNQAKQLTEKEIQQNTWLGETAKYINVVDVSTHKIHISEAEIDLFYNRINDFDYSFVFFKKHYQALTKNLNRFNPKAENKNFDIIMLQHVLKDDPLYPVKAFSVLLYYIKWKFKLTSPLYVWYVKRNFQKQAKKRQAQLITTHYR